MNKLSLEILSLSRNIAQYIRDWVEKNSSLKLRNFYGESFSIALLERHALLTLEVKQILVSKYNDKDKLNSEFHFEFNNYAFLDYLIHSKDEEIKNIFFPLKFKNTPCTNWTLLRSVVRLSCQTDSKLALKEATDKISSFQDDSGLISDDVGVRSFQYHCFSAAMIYEIYTKTQNIYFKNSFLRAVSFIRNFILPNGDTLYVGRGQEQSFGMGALIYILAAGFSETNDNTILHDLTSVLNFLKSHEKKDKTFPLVFNDIEPSSPEDLNMLEEKFCGWYPYNNFFDYLPFLGLFLAKASQILSAFSIDIPQKLSIPHRNFFNCYFQRRDFKNYSIILSLPSGYWSNGLPFPLIFYKNLLQTPILGGEQFQESLYTLDDLSMPITKTRRHSWRKYGKGFFYKNQLVWFSLFGILIRHYRFSKNEITISNYAISFIPSVQKISFFDDLKFFEKRKASTRNSHIHFNNDILKTESGFCPLGKIQRVLLPMNHKTTVELK